MVPNPRVLTPRHERRSRLCDASRSARREVARARVRRSLQESGFRGGNEDQEMLSTNEVVQDIGDGDALRHPPIAFIDGEFSRFESRCVSIHSRYLDPTILMHSSMLPLYHGRCLLHNLGALDFTCSLCGAQAWKVEGKSVRTFVGKYCCSSGKVKLLTLNDPPIELQELMQGASSRSKMFLKNIRAYNNALAFVSLGAHVDERFTRGRGVYTFRVHGSIYHNIGPMVPGETTDQIPRFAQLYFFDTKNELNNRLQHVPNVNRDILLSLQAMMHRVNPYANAFRSAASMVQGSTIPEIRMVITEERSNGWQYLAPRGSEVAAIMPGHGDESNIGHRDIVLQYREGGLKRISSLHRAYMPLLYVLLFPMGDDGWHPYIPLIQANHENDDDHDNPLHTEENHTLPQRRIKYISQKQYYTYRLQMRSDTTKCLLRGGRLLQQYIVDAYSCMEESRLQWMRDNQRTLRVEVYQGLADMVGARDGIQGEIQGVNAGRRVILPSSFVGGPRYMHQLYQDAMAIVRKRGKPDLFITFTCNPRWKEIQDALLPGQTASDRPDLTSRVFYHKFKDLMHLLIKGAIFGDVVGHVSVIEFQKRGLPHAHILLILASEYKPTDVSHYDKMVCAELPDKQLFPELHNVISHCNMHGPCGALNPNAPCMIDGKCRFKYPRNFCAATTIDGDGYPTYMRRNDGKYVLSKQTKLDNRWIVPYNPLLSLRYKAHINVEICSTISAVKYLYKYVYKGHDRATIVLQDGENVLDEITSYLDARYVSASEAIWRIYGFDLHDEKPDIFRLQVHLPYQNMVPFQDSTNLVDIVENDANKKTTLTEWFIANQLYHEANHLSYNDFPIEWVWNPSRKCWTHRKKGYSIGRMYNVVPTAGEVYYLRVLLTMCKGCKSFEDLCTFNGHIYFTFKEACNARGLLQNDAEWSMCLQEASLQRCSKQLRQLFMIILVFCEPLSPGSLWNQFSRDLSEDFFYALRSCTLDEGVRHDIAKNQALSTLEYMLQQHGKRLDDFPGMPQVDRSCIARRHQGLLTEETTFNVEEQRNMAIQMEISLNEGQRIAYHEVIQAVDKAEGAVFFLDGPGGTGKTYIYNALLSRIRGEEKVALACASSGIAALLLSNGRTAHSRFKIPIDLHSESTCNIKVNSDLAQLLRKASLIIWDEAPMTHRYAFEALDRTLRDIMQNEVMFGGKVLLFGGDFRQILPVVRKGSRADTVNAALCHSYLWKCIKVLQLTENMRVLNSCDDASERGFAEWLLNIGDGNISHGDLVDNVTLPNSMLLPNNSLESLTNCIYGDMQYIQDHMQFFKGRGILAPRNKEVQAINDLAVRKMRGVCKEYVSADSVCASNCNSVLYTTEFLNSLDLGGFPPHSLRLKENSPIMLLRNLDPKHGLCNGTRLICKQFHHKVIDAEVITGSHVGERVFIPRIDFIIGASNGLPFEMKRRQFPVKLAFAMTINKAQGQTLELLGLYLATPVFTHGQLYVAMSRVRSSSAIKIVVDDTQRSKPSHGVAPLAYTPNIVYKEVLLLMENRATVRYILGRVPHNIPGNINYLKQSEGDDNFLLKKLGFLTDPPLWRGPIMAFDVVHLLEDFEVVRHHYYKDHLLMALHHLEATFYYHVSCDIDKDTGLAHISVMAVSHKKPINIEFSVGFQFENWTLKLFTVGDVPENLEENVRYIGPWAYLA